MVSGAILYVGCSLSSLFDVFNRNLDVKIVAQRSLVGISHVVRGGLPLDEGQA